MVEERRCSTFLFACFGWKDGAIFPSIVVSRRGVPAGFCEVCTSACGALHFDVRCVLMRAASWRVWGIVLHCAEFVTL